LLWNKEASEGGDNFKNRDLKTSEGVEKSKLQIEQSTWKGSKRREKEGKEAVLLVSFGGRIAFVHRL
jgi:hypothetical protein